jgi:HlyD family secretion protein
MIRLAPFLLAVLLLAACEQGSDNEVAVGTLERDRVEITADSWERLVAIEVTEGDGVIAGQVLARQETERAEIRLAQLEAAAEQARRRLAELERGPREEDIAEGRAALRGAEDQLAAEARELDRIADLIPRNLASESDLDRARARRDAARAARDEARARLTALESGTTKEELDQARAAVAEAEAAAADQRLTLDRLIIRATRDGIVDALPFEVGDRPRAGDVVAVLLADGAPYARVYVPAALRARVRPGTAATVAVEGVQGVFEGRVRIVASEAAFTPYFALTERDRGRLSYLAEVVLTDAAAAELPTGLPVEARFPEGTRGDGGR